jgi:cytoskeletal protein CcmA (bactofilin family)
MWKRDESVRPAQPTSPNVAASVTETPAARTESARQQERDMVNIGKSVIIKGELSGSEDLTIEGQVEGKIELKQNVLTIGPNGRIKAQIVAKAVVVQGEVTGNVTATERVDIRDAGSVDGDLSAPRVAIADGAHFRGSIDMQKSGAKPADHRPAETKPGEARPATPPTTTTATATPASAGVAATPAR